MKIFIKRYVRYEYMDNKKNYSLNRCAEFLSRMIEKYVSKAITYDDIKDIFSKDTNKSQNLDKSNKM